MILAEESICFLASKKKIEFLRKLENQKAEETGVPPVKLLVRDRVSISCDSCFVQPLKISILHNVL